MPQATDVADYLVGKGLPFRDAHRVAGQAGGPAGRGRTASGRRDASTSCRRISPLFDEDYYPVVDLDRVVAAKVSPGGTAPAAGGRAAGARPDGAGPALAVDAVAQRCPALATSVTLAVCYHAHAPRRIGFLRGDRSARTSSPAPSDEVAPDLIGKILWRRGRRRRPADRGGGLPARRRIRPLTRRAGRRRRNAAMFGPPGTIYVFLSYGVHTCSTWCATGEGVGLRRAHPRASRRSALGRTAAARCAGRAASAQALRIRPGLNGLRARASASGLFVLDDGCAAGGGDRRRGSGSRGATRFRSAIMRSAAGA